MKWSRKFRSPQPRDLLGFAHLDHRSCVTDRLKGIRRIVPQQRHFHFQFGFRLGKFAERFEPADLREAMAYRGSPECPSDAIKRMLEMP